MRQPICFDAAFSGLFQEAPADAICRARGRLTVREMRIIIFRAAFSTLEPQHASWGLFSMPLADDYRHDTTFSFRPMTRVLLG